MAPRCSCLARPGPILGNAPPAEAQALELFQLEKAAYELAYEANNRPAWLGVPLRGLAALADRLLGPMQPTGGDSR